MPSRFIYADEVTDEQIAALRAEATEAGDDRMVITCDRAAAGDDSARERVAAALTDALARSAGA